MTNREILDIAMGQSAIDCNCEFEDFYQSENKIVISKEHHLARKYLVLPFYCDLVSYGNNIVASVDPEVTDTVSKYLNKYAVEHCFETPNLHVLNDEFQKHGRRICFMAEYFLPDMDVLKPIPHEFEIKVLHAKDFAVLPIYISRNGAMHFASNGNTWIHWL